MSGLLAMLLQNETQVTQHFTAITFFSYFWCNLFIFFYRNLFQAAQPYTNDVQSLYYSVLGTELLGGGLDFSKVSIYLIWFNF